MPRSAQNIRSEEIQDILTKVPHWMIVWGNTFILIMLLVFLLFSWMIKYPDIIETEATITSQIPPQKEFAQRAGKLDTILAVDNQVVLQGDVLAMLENNAKLKDVLLLKSTLDTVSLEQGSFFYPINHMPVMSLGEIASAYVIFEKDYLDYSMTKELNPYANRMTANLLSESELQQRLKNLQEQQVIDQKKLKLSQNEFGRNKQLFEKGVISLNEFEAKHLSYLEDETRLKNMEITISQLKQLINDASKNSKETKINNQMEDTRLFKAVIQSFAQLKNAIKAWEHNYLLKANITGRVSFINVLNEQQNIAQGDLLFTIIPTQSNKYIAKIKAPIRNSGKIKKSQKVHIKLLNYPDTEYGMLKGKVDAMSALPNQEGVYLINVVLPNKLTTSYNIDIPFKNEMTGTAEIITDDLRLMERFFYQLRGIFTN